MKNLNRLLISLKSGSSEPIMPLLSAVIFATLRAGEEPNSLVGIPAESCLDYSDFSDFQEIFPVGFSL